MARLAPNLTRVIGHNMLKLLSSIKFILGAGAVACLLSGYAGYKVGTIMAERVTARVQQELSDVKLEYEQFISQSAIDIANANAAALAEHTRLIDRIQELEVALEEERTLRRQESLQLTERLRHAQQTGEGDDRLGTAMLNYLSQLRYYQERYGTAGNN